MTTWLLEPRDPLIFRDGRPFTAVPGERAVSMPFPFPATLAGAVRTLVAAGDFTDIAKLKQKSMRGPFLVELDSTGAKTEWYFPAPADALLVEDRNQDPPAIKRHSLRPISLPAGVSANLADLLLVTTRDPVKDKSFSKAPRFWRWSAYLEWLLTAPNYSIVNPDDLGILGLLTETRTHVAIEPKTQTAAIGALFQTSGLEFALPPKGSDEHIKLGNLRHFALALDTDETLPGGLGFLGGERRAVTWRKTDAGLPEFPKDLKAKILSSRSCRLILATPGYFEDGHLPRVLKTKGGGINVHAAAVPRYQTISGWDYEKRQPKPTRRLAPAGSTYFIKFTARDAELVKLLDELWLRPINDDPQFDRDGFGLPLLGFWDAAEVQK